MPNSHKSIYTTQEAAELGIPYAHPPPAPLKCEYCGETLYCEGLLIFGKIFCWNTNPRCVCKQAIKYWKQYDIEEKKGAEEKEIAQRRQRINTQIERLIGKS